ncbi:MAG: O-antigen ligase family protein [Elusimicrobiota bacterium]|jgi:O-antigen ligase
MRQRPQASKEPSEPHPLKSLYGAGLWTAAFLLPLAVLPLLISGFGLAKLSCLSVSVGLMGLGLALGKPRAMEAPRALLWPLLAGLAVLAASLLASRDVFLSVFGQYDHYAFGAYPMALLAGLCLMAALASWRERQRTLDWMLAAAGLVAGLGLLQAAGFASLGPAPGFTGARPIATIGGAVSFAAYLCVMFPLALHRCLEGRTLWPWLVLGLTGLGLLASGGRAGLVGACAGALAYLACSGGLPRSRQGRLWLVAGLVALAGFAAWRLSTRPLRTMLSADVARVEVWRVAWDAFKDRPLLGAGPDAFELEFRQRRGEDLIRRTRALFPTHSHNDVLQAMATTGLLGLAAYLAVLLAGGALILQRLKEPGSRSWAAAMAGGLASAFVVMKFNPVSFETLAPAGLLLGFLAPAPEPEGGSPRPGLSRALAALGIASCLLCLWLVRVDAGVSWCFSVGRLQGPGLGLSCLIRAVDRRPCETRYQALMADVLNEALASLPLERGRGLLSSAGPVAEQGAACRPRYAPAADTLGFLALMQAKAGDSGRLDLAEASFDRALELDPCGKGIVYRRMLAARERGDKDLERSLKERYERLHALGKD